MKIVEGIHMLPGIKNECNIYLIDCELVVDTGTGEFFTQARTEIENICGIESVKRILNTHGHFDHIGGNLKFRNASWAEILCHEKEKKMVETGEGSLSEVFGKMSRFAQVGKTFKDGDILETKSFSFSVIHTPGHTPGSICLYEPRKKILLSGDTLFDFSVGRTDFPGGSASDMRKSLQKLSLLDINHLLPGHGAPRSMGVDFMLKQLLNSMRVEKHL